MKKPQWITLAVAVLLMAALFLARTVPAKKVAGTKEEHQHDLAENLLPVDSILVMAKDQLGPSQKEKVETLENSLSKADKEEKIHLYHQLARFWSDSVKIFEPYAWYEAEAARLENSEKSLTFAARLFLDNLQTDAVTERRQWKALESKDLFERSLKLNPANDSAKAGIGACYLFGNIAQNPMEGVSRIKDVVERDSTNLYAQMLMAKGLLMSGQYDKAINRLQTVNRLETNNLEAIMLLADTFERTGDKQNAVAWYQKSIPLIMQPEMKAAVAERIKELQN